MKLKVKFVLIFVIISFSVSNLHQANSTAGNSIATAINLPLNATVNGTVGPLSPIYYNITIGTPGDYTFYLNSDPSNDFILSLYHPGNYWSLSSYTPYPKIIAENLNTGVHTVEVSSNNETGSFSISCSASVQGQTLDQAISLPLNTSISGIAPFDIFFNFSLTKSGYAKINLTTAPTTFATFYLFSSEGNFIGQATNWYNPEKLVINLVSGDYYIQIAPLTGLGPYNISVVPYTINPGEDIAHAINVSLNTTYLGTMGITTYFNVTLPISGYYDFRVDSNSNYTAFIQILDSSNNIIGGIGTYSYPEDYISNITAGKYTAQMIFENDNGLFNFTVSPYSIKPGEDLSHAIYLPMNTTLSTPILYASYINITITNPGTYKINITNLDNNTLISAYLDYSNWFLIDSSFLSNSSISLIDSLQPGNYIIYVLTYNRTGSFNITYCPYNPKPGETIGNAITLPIGSTLNATVQTKLYFNFSVIQQDIYILDFKTNPSNKVGFQLLDRNGNYVSSYHYTYNNITSTFEQNYTLSSGLYIVQVFSFYSSVNFSLSLKSLHPQPSTTSITSSLTTTTNSNPASTISNTSKSTLITTLNSSVPFSPIEFIFSSFILMMILKHQRRKNK